MEVPNNTTSSASFRDIFESELTEYEQKHQGAQKKPWTAEKVFEVMNNIRKARVTESSNQPRTSMDYYWLSKYDIMKIENKECLIFKRKTLKDPTICIVPKNEYFSILEEVHISCGHGGRDKMTQAIKSKFYIPKKAVEIFVSHCPICETKKQLRKGIVSQDFNITGQVDLIEFQSCHDADGEYKCMQSAISTYDTLQDEFTDADTSSGISPDRRPSSTSNTPNQAPDDIPESDDAHAPLPFTTHPHKRQTSNRKRKLTNEKVSSTHEAFGHYIADKLQNLPHKQRIFAEKIINDAIFEAELGNLSRDCYVYVPARIKTSGSE
ncbi:KRAB-A domain-containing protein 2-like [Cydia amplana]|uniref:KRAB-A domain-containing protein 2-like n=1 Tax=Cydia amplana TaxID=1869771 RepID=UPI002FE50AAD